MVQVLYRGINCVLIYPIPPERLKHLTIAEKCGEQTV